MEDKQYYFAKKLSKEESVKKLEQEAEVRNIGVRGGTNYANINNEMCFEAYNALIALEDKIDILSNNQNLTHATRISALITNIKDIFEVKGNKLTNTQIKHIYNIVINGWERDGVSTLNSICVALELLHNKQFIGRAIDNNLHIIYPLNLNSTFILDRFIDRYFGKCDSYGISIHPATDFSINSGAKLLVHTKLTEPDKLKTFLLDKLKTSSSARSNTIKKDDLKILDENGEPLWKSL